MRRARQKSEAMSFLVPQCREDVVSAIAEIGRLQRERDRIQAEMNDELSRVRERFEEMAHPYAEKIRQLSAGVQVWCEANRAELTVQGKTKTVNLSSGEVKWRMRPPKVVLRGVEMVLESLRLRGLERFIRVKEEINKEAILAEPEAVSQVKGISIARGEDFVIIPFETKLEEVAL